jgi:hypothetical protein
MIRYILYFIIISGLLTSCGNTCNKDVASSCQEQGAKIAFSSLIEHPENYIDKNIIIEGKVIHVCIHSGKKLFIVGDNPDVRLFVSAGEDVPRFSTDLLGSEVVVEGLISRIAGAESGVATLKGPAGKKQDEDCETETALAAQPVLANLVMEYKSHSVK